MSRGATPAFRAGVPDYSAAKAALNNYAKGPAGEYAAHGLCVVTTSPGPPRRAFVSGLRGRCPASGDRGNRP